MSQLNVNNTDDLFKRASEEYPLRTDNSDWDRLSADLDKDPSLILPPHQEEGGRSKRRFFWLFLLLPLGGLGYYVWQTHPAAAQHASSELGRMLFWLHHASGPIALGILTIALSAAIGGYIVSALVWRAWVHIKARRDENGAPAAD